MTTDQEKIDVIWGAEEIGKVIGRSARMTFHMLSTGQLPGRKVCGRWCASRKKLEKFFEEDAA
uniref:DNA-binding protein n=1 Tax=Stappia sp. TaxID=1870903 RepID=UPI003BAADD2F